MIVASGVVVGLGLSEALRLPDDQEKFEGDSLLFAHVGDRSRAESREAVLDREIQGGER